MTALKAWTTLTAAEAHQTPCYRCGNPVGHGIWSACADQSRVVCADCDVAANVMMLTWIGSSKTTRKIRAYTKKVRACPWCAEATKALVTETKEE